MMTDPIADMLTRLRNAQTAGKPDVNILSSRLAIGIAKVLRREGFIKDFTVVQDGRQGILRIYLKYGPSGERTMRQIRRVSSPGRRIYRRASELSAVLNGMGIAILTTSKGVLSDRECRQQRLGGEVIAKIG